MKTVSLYTWQCFKYVCICVSVLILKLGYCPHQGHSVSMYITTDSGILKSFAKGS